MAKDMCYYAGEEYSEGSIIEVDDGEYQECINDDGSMYWQDVEERSTGVDPGGSEATPDGAAPEGGVIARKSKSCSYGGKKYSLGAKLKMPNGKMYKCYDQPNKKPGWSPV